MAWFPIMIELEGRPCLVAGGGAVALRKAAAMLDAGADVTMISPRFDDKAKTLPVRRISRPVEPQDVQDMVLVVDATGEADAACALRQACRKERIPFNCAAYPEQGDVAFSAVLRRGDLVAGFATTGTSPAAAAWLRDRTEELLPERFEEILAQMESLRVQAKESMPHQHDRARFLHACLDEALRRGRPLSDDEIGEIERRER